MAEVKFAPGEMVFVPGDPGDRAFLIRRGEVEMLTGDPARPTRVATFGPGDVFGEMSLVEERPHTMAARALTAVDAVPMTRPEFERLLTADPKRAQHYLRSLFERLRSLSARLAELSAPPRPASTLPGPVAFPNLPQDVPPVPAPVVILHPLTRRAAETLPDEGLRVTRFPLRIGRAAEANEPGVFDLNDLWLLDFQPYNVSRNHCGIELADNNQIIVRDRGSHLGCFVNEEYIGGRSPFGYTHLHTGENVLILGGRLSPYQFRVTVS